jgi:hypothetical protein
MAEDFYFRCNTNGIFRKSQTMFRKKCPLSAIRNPVNELFIPFKKIKRNKYNVLFDLLKNNFDFKKGISGRRFFKNLPTIRPKCLLCVPTPDPP